MNLKKAIQGYLLEAAAGNMSAKTINLYRINLNYMADYLNDPEIENIKPEHLISFLAYLNTEYKPRRRGIDKLSGASIDIYWKAIRSFFGWAEKTLSIERSDLTLPRPKYRNAETTPYTEDDMKKIITACEYTIEANTEERKSFRMKRPTAKRDKAMVLLFLDTGARLGEVQRLRIRDINLETGEVFIRSNETGIKSRPRTVYIERAARRAIWLYLSSFDPEPYPDDSLFGLESHSIGSLLRRIGERTNIHVHPHRFRHTFAIQYLRNGGDVFTLQRLLGHATLEMVKHYLLLADADASKVHRTASPVDRWKL